MIPDIALLLDDEARYENCNLLHRWNALRAKQASRSPFLAINISIWERLIQDAARANNFQLTVEATEMIATFMEHIVLQLVSRANQLAACRGSVMVTPRDITNAQSNLNIAR